MFSTSPLSRSALIFVFAVSFFLISQVPGYAEEMTSCKGLRGKELVLCWKKMDPERARGDHEAFHRSQSAAHLKWHQEHRSRTDAQVTIDHQKSHQDAAQKHQDFHRSSKGQEESKGGGQTVTTPAKQRDTEAAPNKGLSKRRQLRSEK